MASGRELGVEGKGEYAGEEYTVRGIAEKEGRAEVVKVMREVEKDQEAARRRFREELGIEGLKFFFFFFFFFFCSFLSVCAVLVGAGRILGRGSDRLLN